VDFGVLISLHSCMCASNANIDIIILTSLCTKLGIDKPNKRLLKGQNIGWSW